MEWQYNDGGRSGAGYKGDAGDCVVRAIAIATDRPYKDVYDVLWAEIDSKSTVKRGNSPRNGVAKKAIKRYMESLGWTWTPTMQIGSGCKVHLRADELPTGTIVVSVSKHVCAVIDGVVHDTYDPTRDGTRCVYGYWSLPTA
jgi:hypothetical protein